MTELDHKLRADYDKIGKSAKYGTAGFRDHATNMPYVSNFIEFFRFHSEWEFSSQS